MTPLETPVINKATPVKTYNHDELLRALYFFWDAFERATMNFFLVGKTGEQIKNNENLSGDRLTLGIRRLEWVGGQGGVFKAFMEHEKILPKKLDKDTLLFTYHDVPVYLKLYDDNPYITALDIAFYGNETFNIPNPLDKFNKEYV